jgi:hypothetical protein
MKTLHIAALFGLAVQAAFAAPASGVTPVSRIGTYTLPIAVSGAVLQIPYDASASVSSSSSQVLRAVVLIHGSSRDSKFAYDTLVQAAALAGRNDPSTLLVAPQFLVEEDIVAFALPADRLFWSEPGWKEGNQSLSTSAHPRPARLSSFAVLDTLLDRIAVHCPNLGSVVVAGHSAGGQFVNRYAAGNVEQLRLQTTFGVTIAYLPANPSSYLYFDGQRVRPGTTDVFEIPSAAIIQGCSWYDDYKYGLQDRNNYFARISTSQIRTQFAARQANTLLGELDNDPHGADLDTTCAAMLQGPNRRVRGEIYGRYLVHAFGAGVASSHRTMIVPGVGHDSRDMFTSPCGVSQLFTGGASGCDPVDAAEVSATAGLVLLPSLPNPFRRQTSVLVQVQDSSRHTTLGVYDARGRLVRTLLDGEGPSQLTSFAWDGRSHDGRHVSAGVYFLRLQQGQARVTQRVTLLR